MSDHKKKKPKDISKEDQELFLNAFYQGEDSIVAEDEPKPKPKSKKKTSDLSEDERELFISAVDSGSIPQEVPPDQSMAARPNAHSKGKRRNYIDAYLDLHGLYSEDAISLLMKFISREKERGSKNLLVVHGKGTGTLKNAVRSFVDCHPDVDDYQEAPGKFGGGGAIILRVNRTKGR